MQILKISFKISRAIFAGLSLALFACNSLDIGLRQDSFFALEKNSSQKIAIVVQASASPEELEAARILRDCLVECGIEVIKPDEFPDYQGNYRCVKLSRKNPDSLISEDAIAKLRSEIELNVDKDCVEILYSKNPQAAVAYFLRKLGFEFLAPTRLGLICPASDILEIKCGKYISSPKFVSSNIYLGRLLKDPDSARVFLNLNGINPTFNEFSHNLYKIFDEQIIERYPQLKPQLCKNRNNQYFQPDISNPLAPIIAADAAMRFFEKNPEEIGYSIAISDNLNYDLRVRPNPPPYSFAYGYQNYSNAYFDFANKTAEIVSQKFPNKLLGALAYLTTESAPDFEVNKNIAVYATSDHANYYSKEFKKSDFNKLANWGKSGARALGVYSYIYGSSYRIPRNIDKFEFEAMREAYRMGFRFYFAESSPIWPYDNFKLWLVLRILDGDDRTYAELKRHYFDTYYAESSKSAERFFDLSEEAWAGRSDAPRWLGLYKQTAQAELFPQDRLEEMEEALKKAEADAKSELVKARIFELRLEFEQTKKFCAYYLAKKAVFKAAVQKKCDGVAKLIEGLKSAAGQSDLYAAMRDRFTKFPSAKYSDVNNFIPPIDTLLVKNFANLSEGEIDKLRKNLGDEKLVAISKSIKNPKRTIFETKFNYPEFAKAIPTIGEFPNFLTATVFPDSNCSFCILRKGDEFFARIANTNPFEISKTSYVDAGKTYVFTSRLRFELSMSARAYLTIAFADKNGNIIKRETSGFAPQKEALEREFTIVSEAPQGAEFAGFGLSGMSFRDGDFIELKSLKLEEVLDN